MMVKANDGVSFAIRKGNIHALIGENGAGKSTIMNILFGLYQATSGEIFKNGRLLKTRSPFDAKKEGIGMVHQHFILAGPLLAIDHILLDEDNHFSLKKSLMPIHRKNKIAELEALSKSYNMPVPWQKKIEELSVGIQQRIEILKLLHGKAEILILDEPTAVLTPQEIESLFEQLLVLKSQGKTIIIITHKLKEVLHLSDEVTVFRKGQVVGHVQTAQASEELLSEMMIGQKLERASSSGEIAKKDYSVQIENLSLKFNNENKPRLQNVNIQINSGEIVGLAGVEGNGQSQLIQALLNPLQFEHATISAELNGKISLNGENILRFSNEKIRNKGLAYLPEDRLAHGALPEFNLSENFLLGHQHDQRFNHSGILQFKELGKITDVLIEKYDVRPRLKSLLFKNLSGGNQQKLVVARELWQQPKFLLAAHPTRGVDLGASQTIHQEIFNCRSAGSAVLLISSDLDELMRLSDRIVVIYDGKIQGQISKQEFSQNHIESKIGLMMTGGSV